MSVLSDRAQQMVEDAREAKRQKRMQQMKLEDFDAVGKAAQPPKVFPRYTAEAMVELMIAHPTYTHAQFAAHFGYRASWFAGVLVSPNLQAALDGRREEVNNPNLTGTIEDMFRALLIRSVTVLQAKMEDDKVLDDTVLKAAALGVKALGLGEAKKEEGGTGPQTLSSIADRLASAMAGRAQLPPPKDHTIDAVLKEVPNGK